MEHSFVATSMQLCSYSDYSQRQKTHESAEAHVPITRPGIHINAGSRYHKS